MKGRPSQVPLLFLKQSDAPVAKVRVGYQRCEHLLDLHAGGSLEVTAKRLISVMHVTNALANCGAEENLLTLLRGLRRDYFRLYLLCPPESAASLGAAIPRDVEVVAPLRSRKPNRAPTAWDVEEVLRKLRVDILHSHSRQSSRCASPVGWLCGVPAILETTNDPPNGHGGWLAPPLFLHRYAAWFVDVFIAVSEANARYLTEKRGLPKRKVVVIRQSCDLARFDPDQPPPSDIRDKLGFEESDPVVILPGPMESHEGHRVFLKALTFVRHEFPRVRAVFAGEGNWRRELERLADALGLGATVRFIGSPSKIADWLALADVTVFPSPQADLPFVALQSLAMARPVVAVEGDGAAEVVRNGVTGLTVPPQQPCQLAEAISILLSSPDLRSKLGRQGRECIAARFSSERQVRETQDLYLRALEQSSSNPPYRQTSRYSANVPWTEVQFKTG